MSTVADKRAAKPETVLSLPVHVAGGGGGGSV